VGRLPHLLQISDIARG